MESNELQRSTEQSVHKDIGVVKTCDFLFKIVLLGSPGVGKSCLLLRFCENAFTTDHMQTVGIDYRTRVIDVDGKKVRLQLWDTAGQERFGAIVNSYFRGAAGFVIVYDVTNEESFNKIEQIMTRIENYASQGSHVIIVGNKCDLSDRRKISKEEGEQLATKLGVIFIESSALANINVHKAFYMLTEEVKKQIESKFMSESSKDEFNAPSQNNLKLSSFEAKSEQNCNCIIF